MKTIFYLKTTFDFFSSGFDKINFIFPRQLKLKCFSILYQIGRPLLEQRGAQASAGTGTGAQAAPAGACSSAAAVPADGERAADLRVHRGEQGVVEEAARLPRRWRPQEDGAQEAAATCRGLYHRPGDAIARQPRRCQQSQPGWQAHGVAVGHHGLGVRRRRWWWWYC